MTGYYAELQVSASAEQEVIEKAYKALIFKYHPDRGGDEEKAKRLTAAYYVLSDPGRRAEYDAQRTEDAYRHSAGGVSQHTAPQNPTSGSHAYVNIEDIPPEVIDAILARVWLEGAGATVRTAARVVAAAATAGISAVGDAFIQYAPDGHPLSKQEQAQVREALGDAKGWRCQPSPAAIWEYARYLDRRVPHRLEAPLSLEDLAWIAARHPRAPVRRDAYELGAQLSGAVALVSTYPGAVRSTQLFRSRVDHVQETKYSTGSRWNIDHATFVTPSELGQMASRDAKFNRTIAVLLGFIALLVGLSIVMAVIQQIAAWMQ